MRDQTMSPLHEMHAEATIVAWLVRRSIASVAARPAGLAGWLRQIGSGLVAEHTCAPPTPLWKAIPTHLARHNGSTYQCPECEQVFAAPKPARVGAVVRMESE